MADLSTYAHSARARAQSVSGDWVETFARFGYIAKGVVYGLVGILAVQVAFGTGGETTGAQGVLDTIAAQPFGKILLGLTALGLIGYVVWRFAEAFLDAENNGTDAEGLVKRIGYGVSGGTYGLLAYAAIRMVLGTGSSGGGSGGNQGWTAELMSQPFGQWLVGIVGAIIVGVGLYHFYKVYTAKFMTGYKAGEMSTTERIWAKRIGRFGLAARGITFGIIGGFVLQAALQAQPGEAEGLGAALDTLARQPYGPWLLGIVALGFVAYGVYCFSRARYRHFRTA